MGYWEQQTGDPVERDLAAYEAREAEREAEERALRACATEIAEQALTGSGYPLPEEEAVEALVELVADALQDDVCDAREAFRELMDLAGDRGVTDREVAEAARVLRDRLLEAAPELLAEKARSLLEQQREEAAVADAEARGLLP